MVKSTTAALYQSLLQYIPPHRLLLKEPMSRHTSFQIGGPCDMMVLIHSAEELARILSDLKEAGETPFVMGNGSNLLVRDGGLRRVVLKIESDFREVARQGDTLIAQAGVTLPQLARHALEHELTGIEFASGIPGTLGGALMMNAGAYGGEMNDVVTEVTLMDGEGNLRTFSNAQMCFGYRKSALTGTGRIALGAKIRLSPGSRPQILAKMQELAQKRRDKQPLSLPSAGSAFERPPGHFAGQLIEQAGLKGKGVGGARVSEKHAGFIVSDGTATARDVESVIEMVKTKVFETSGVMLCPEIKVVGEEA